MKGPATPFAQIETTQSLHSRVTRALALRVINAERDGQLISFPNEGELCKQLGVSRSILREAVKVLENKGPAIMMAGIARISPRSKVNPILACSCATRATGDGWGGRNPWVTDKAASMGSPTYTAGNLY